MARHNGYPKYRLHKPSGKAVVTISGKDHYLGKFGTRDTSPQSWEMYDRLIAEWLHAKRPTVPLEPGEGRTITAIVVRYLHDVAGNVYTKNDRPTFQRNRVTIALGHVTRLYGSLPADQFGPKCLRVVREEMARKDLSRRYINSLVNCVKQCWDWAAEQELIPMHALRAVRGLRKGAPGVREAVRVRLVPWKHVEAALAELPPVVHDMAMVQYLTGMRPCEVCHLAAEYIDQTGQVLDGPRLPGQWIYEVPDAGNKNAHKDQRRTVVLGKRAQEILQPYLERKPSGPLFSPRESTIWFMQQAGRKINLDRKRAPGEQYTTRAYEQAIESACRRADRKARAAAIVAGATPADAERTVYVQHWSPNRLRHTRATEIRSKWDEDHARVVLGHALAGVTGRYAEADLAKAAKVMRKIG